MDEFDKMAAAIFVTVLLLAAVCQSAENHCIIVPFFSDNLPEVSKETLDEVQAYLGNISPKILLINNEREFDTVIEFISRVFEVNVTDDGCSEVIGVVGDLDLKTASIIHTLASRANLSITLVSAVAPSTFLPATHLALPNLLHINPLTHYVEALAAFLDGLNWTRIGLISDNTP